MLPVSQIVKILLLIIALGIMLFLKRGYILVALGSRALHAKHADPQKAWNYYIRAWKSGLPSHYTVMLANLFVQRGDPKVAMEIYESVLEKELKKRTDSDTLINVRISRTMGLWALDRGDEAIDELQKLYGEGRRDRSLLINLGTYLLESDRLDEAGLMLEECADLIPESPGMTDNKGLYLLKRGSYEEAREVYDFLLSREKPQFPEAYVHAAQTWLALGNLTAAYGLLQQAEELEFFQTASVTKAMVQQMMQDIQDDPNFSTEAEDSAEQLIANLYDMDLFDDSLPNTEVDDEDDLEPNIDLDAEDFDDEDDPEVIVDPDEISPVESEFFDDEYDDEDEEEKK
mgnify:CR=1 FL=1